MKIKLKEDVYSAHLFPLEMDESGMISNAAVTKFVTGAGIDSFDLMVDTSAPEMTKLVFEVIGETHRITPGRYLILKNDWMFVEIITEDQLKERYDII